MVNMTLRNKGNTTKKKNFQVKWKTGKEHPVIMSL